MPYLPVFVLLFLPMAAFEFTTSYLLFCALNLAILALYLVRFSRALGLKPGPLRLMEWMICLPFLATLSLGQSNLFLVICLCEFILAFMNGKQVCSGMWLAGLMIKPHTLILLLPGLVMGRRWRALYGFGAGTLIVLGCSLLLAGVEGVAESLDLAFRFAGPLIQTAAAMMNWRALALNLEAIWPGWAPWVIAGLGMVVVAAVALYQWRQFNKRARDNFLLLMLASLSATFALSWHSHFYLMVMSIPILLALDLQDKLPTSILAAWAFGPLGLYLMVNLFYPGLARNIVGLGFLGLNLLLLAWAAAGLHADR
jgi:hypothetical protein